MATRFNLLPEAASFPTANFPQLMKVNSRFVLAFDAATDEVAYWTQAVPQGVTGSWTAVISYFMASANSGTVGFQVAVEAVSDGDALDLGSSSSFDTVNNSASITVPDTVGYIDQVTVNLTNVDGLAQGDYVRFSLNRDADGSAIADSAAGDAYVLAIEIRDGA